LKLHFRKRLRKQTLSFVIMRGARKIMIHQLRIYEIDPALILVLEVGQPQARLQILLSFFAKP
jgi:hypothetical protein